MSGLAASDRSLLLRLARASIGEALTADGSLARLLSDLELPGELLVPRGVFVSLKRETLRGCVGTVSGGGRPLYRSIIEMAEAAALRDPRFPPLGRDELDETRIEISVLGSLRPIGGPDELVVGRDGVQLTLGDARAVFLPQVAVEHGWSAVELLQRLARKAGLDGEAWSAAGLAAFDAEIFGDPYFRGRENVSKYW